MSTCPCPACNRPAHPDWTICTHHAWTLGRDLSDAPSLIRELGLTMSRQRATANGGGGKSAEKPLPYDPRAGAALTHLDDTLRRWARKTGFDVKPSHTPTAVALALHAHHQLLVVRIDAHTIVGDIDSACRDGWRVVQPNSRGRIPLPDACPELGCGARMWATMHDVDDPRPNLVWCEGHTEGATRHEWGPEQWLRLGHRLGYGRTG